MQSALAVARSKVRGLYVIVDPEATRERPVREIAEAALVGGASMIQLRDKLGDKGLVLPVAREIREMCQAHDALFIMNDDPSLAVLSEADGLHVGATDLPIAEARRILTPDQIVGRSNNTMGEIEESVRSGADYLAVGAVFPTSTMGKGGRRVVGVDMVAEVKEKAAQPVVAIGGIRLDNVAEVVRAGADCVCVVSEVTLADDPKAAAARLVEAIRRAAG